MTMPATHLKSTSAVKFVVIGASTGGVEAIGALLAAIPADSNVSVAIVLHLPPDRPSMLVDVFGVQCALPVKEPEDKEQIVPGTIYIAPPNYHLLIEPGYAFALSSESAVLYSRPSIDVLFESAAYAYGPALLGVILTGASSDGALGLAEVRNQGGRAWVQDPASARASVMPQAACDTADPHRVLELTQLADELAGVMSGIKR